MIAAYYVLYWGSFANFTAAIDHNPTLYPDFAEFYYPAGKAILENTALPESFYYSTFAAFLFAPFALFPLPAALMIWGVVQLALIFLLFRVSAGRLPKIPALGYIFTFLFFTSAALLNNLKWGQVSTLIFLGVFAAFLYYEQNKPTLSALVLSVVIAIKFFPAIFLIYFILLKDWKYLFTCLLMTLAWLVLIPALVFGLAEAIRGQLAVTGHAATMVRLLAMDNIDSQYFASVIARVLRFPILSTVTDFLVYAGYAWTGLVIYVVYRITRARITDAAFWCWGLLAATIPFWIPSAWPHYFVFLPYLQTLAFQRLPELQPRWRRPAVVLWIFSILLSSILIAQAVQNWFRYVGIGALFWSNFFVLSLAIMILLPQLLQRDPRLK